MYRSKTSPLLSAFSFVLILAASLIWSERALAAPPTVAASIKPVQALAKMVMGSLGTPELIIPATASPHVFSLKPSQAKMLENANVVFWIGPDLETTLQGPLKKLSQNATVIALMATEGLDLIDHEGTTDPHIWLSPSNAKVMVDRIEKTLSQADPANAAEYAANAKKAKRRISILINKTNQFTANMRTTPYVVQHDAFGYLAREFGFNEVGRLQTVPGRKPGAKHMAGLIDVIERQGVKCLFHEPQFTPKLAQRVSQEHGLSLREIDPLGGDLSLSETTYVRIIQQIVLSMQSCLAPQDQKTEK